MQMMSFVSTWKSKQKLYVWFQDVSMNDPTTRVCTYHTARKPFQKVVRRKFTDSEDQKLGIQSSVFRSPNIVTDRGPDRKKVPHPEMQQIGLETEFYTIRTVQQYQKKLPLHTVFNWYSYNWLTTPMAGEPAPDDRYRKYREGQTGTRDFSGCPMSRSQ